MVDVINDEPDPKASRELTCRDCGRKLRYWRTDIQRVKYRDYDGYPDVSCSIICPKCGGKNSVKDF